MGQIIAILNQKGGVGKTTTAINLSSSLASLGCRVLLVDLDPQGNSTTGLGIDKRSLLTTTYDLLCVGIPFHQVVCETAVERLHLLPATIDLAGAEIELVTAMARETKLATALRPVADDYDFILLDTPPSLGLLTINCLTCADHALIPIQCEYYALEGLAQLTHTIDLVTRHLNPSLTILGVLLTMYDARTKLAQQVADEIRRHFGNQVFHSIIPRSVRLSEAPSYGEPVLSYAPDSRGAIAYLELAKEVISIGEAEKRTECAHSGSDLETAGADSAAPDCADLAERISAPPAAGSGEAI